MRHLPFTSYLKQAAIATLFLLTTALIQGCGLQAKAVTIMADDFRTTDEIAVYDENGRFLPYPDCIAYAKLGVAPTGDLVEDLITLGKRYLGKPYRYRGAAPWPFDCSGYLRFLFGSFGIPLANSSAAMAEATIPIDNPEPGDLLFFKGRNARSNRIGHVALVIEVKENGGIVMLHSSSSRGIVIEHLYHSAYFSRRFVNAGRIPKLYRYFEARRASRHGINSPYEAFPPTFVHGAMVPIPLLMPTVPAFEG